MVHSDSLIQFSGHQYLRHRLVLSILSGRPVRIDKIRSEDKNPGLTGEKYLHFTGDALIVPERLRNKPSTSSRKSNQWNDYRDICYGYARRHLGFQGS